MDAYLGQSIVVDTDGPYAYVGTLAEANERYFRLTEVAVYDRHEARVPLEKYLIECRRDGVGAARREIVIPAGRVMALSRLADVVVP